MTINCNGKPISISLKWFSKKRTEKGVLFVPYLSIEESRKILDQMYTDWCFVIKQVIPHSNQIAVIFTFKWTEGGKYREFDVIGADQDIMAAQTKAFKRLVRFLVFDANQISAVFFPYEPGTQKIKIGEQSVFENNPQIYEIINDFLTKKTPNRQQSSVVSGQSSSHDEKPYTIMVHEPKETEISHAEETTETEELSPLVDENENNILLKKIHSFIDQGLITRDEVLNIKKECFGDVHITTKSPTSLVRDFYILVESMVS